MTNSIYPSSSPYFDTDIVNNKFLDVMIDRPFPANPDDVYYTILPVYQYRPDLLAFDLYSNSRLWWVFAARNPNKLGPDPYFDFKAGIGIYLPNYDTLKAYLNL
jgi:hypothetical protein